MIGSEVWVSDSDSGFTTYQPWDKPTTLRGVWPLGAGLTREEGWAVLH